MLKLVECVPNFSEGKNPEAVQKILDAIQSVPGAYLLGKEMDADHNRTVVTFVASPEAAVEAAFRSISMAMQIIDLNHHKGEHPRMGACDVCPFIPLQNMTMEECVALSHALAKRVGNELKIPVFLYESAATRPDRKNLADIRKGEFEKLREWIGTNPDKKPDYGPEAIHPTAGATAIGARFFLIAYNVNLKSENVKIASKIARSIREKDGGFPCVKALGFDLKERQMVQVSMNLTDYRKTSMKTVFDAICAKAKEEGVEVAESEIVGLIPYDAMQSYTCEGLLLKNFQSDQVIENQMAEKKEDPMRSPQAFLEATASSEPTPGGGSVSALAGSLAAALGRMVYGITEKSKKYSQGVLGLQTQYEQMKELQEHLLYLVKEDSDAYQSYMKARKMPQETEEQKEARRVALENATMKSILVPMDTMKKSFDVLCFASSLITKCIPAAFSDIAVSCLMASASIEGAMFNVQTNLSTLKDVPLKEEIQKQTKEILEKSQKIKKETLEKIQF